MPDLMEWPDDAPEPFDVLNETPDGYVTNWEAVGGDAMRWEAAS